MLGGRAGAPVAAWTCEQDTDLPPRAAAWEASPHASFVLCCNERHRFNSPRPEKRQAGMAEAASGRRRALLQIVVPAVLCCFLRNRAE